MDKILAWWPILWAVRGLGLIVLVGGSYVSLLFLARYLRWRTIRGMLNADPPQIDSLSGEFGGAKGEVRLNAQREKLRIVEERLTALENQHRRLAEGVGEMRKDVKRLKK